MALAFDGPFGIRSDNARLQIDFGPVSYSKSRARVAEEMNPNRLPDQT
jgi:hypothetical protein